jgi:uncharacterized membrane protein
VGERGGVTQQEEDTVSTVTESVDVNVPIRTAYNQWTQFEEFPQFMSGVTEIRQLDDTTTHWKTSIDGVKREFDAKITEQLPDERVAWTSIEGSKQAGVVTFHRLDANTTRVTCQMDFEPEGVVEQAGDKLGFLDRQVKGDMKRFKEFIEKRGGVETGAWRGQVDRPTP